MKALDTLVDTVNDRLASPDSPTWPVALARMALGLLWLASLRWKLPPDFESSNQVSLREWLELEVDHAAFGFYGDVIDTVVLPNFTLFAWVVFLAELGVGVALLLGVSTRIAALIGLAMSVNLLIGLLDVPGEWPWSYLMMIMLHGLVLVSRAGNMWSLSALMSNRAIQPTPAP